MTWEQEHALACVKQAMLTVEHAQKWLAQDGGMRVRHQLALSYDHLDAARLVLQKESAP